jgi:hypothetical protein
MRNNNVAARAKTRFETKSERLIRKQNTAIRRILREKENNKKANLYKIKPGFSNSAHFQDEKMVNIVKNITEKSDENRES